jgi:hypothetical protein
MLIDLALLSCQRTSVGGHWARFLFCLFGWDGSVYKYGVGFRLISFSERYIATCFQAPKERVVVFLLEWL